MRHNSFVAGVVSLLLVVEGVSCLTATTRPRHLVVLVHGFSGRATDLGYLSRRLLLEVEESSSKGAASVRVLCSRSNEGRTLDGVAAGGERVAREVVAFIAEEDHFETISFVGNSLGGLYARYALGELYDAGGRIAGVRPGAFATTAAPHLGVEEAAYGFALGPVAKVGAQILPSSLSRTARDLCGQTDVLNRLAVDPRFTEPLGRFQARTALAALDKDFMVPFRSALFTDLDPRRFKREADRVVQNHQTAIYCLLNDDKKQGLDDYHADDARAEGIAEIGGGWSKCAVALQDEEERNLLLSLLSFLPLAHNKLVALERSGLKAMASPFERTNVGRPVMDFLAKWLLSVVMTTTTCAA